MDDAIPSSSYTYDLDQIVNTNTKYRKFPVKDCLRFREDNNDVVGL